MIGHVKRKCIHSSMHIDINASPITASFFFRNSWLHKYLASLDPASTLLNCILDTNNNKMFNSSCLNVCINYKHLKMGSGKTLLDIPEWTRAKTHTHTHNPTLDKMLTHKTAHLLAEVCGSYFYLGLTSVPLKEERGQKRKCVHLPAQKIRKESYIPIFSWWVVFEEKGGRNLLYILTPLFAFSFPPPNKVKISLFFFSVSGRCLHFLHCTTFSPPFFLTFSLLTPCFSLSGCGFSLLYFVYVCPLSCCPVLFLSLGDWEDKPFNTLFHYCICTGLKAATSC